VNANARTARATVRTLRRENRAIRMATKAVAAGPASAKHHLIAAGFPVATAERFSAAFSRGMVAQDKVTTVIKLKGRRTKRVDVKLYDRETFVARLCVYRPRKNVAEWEASLFAAMVA